MAGTTNTALSLVKQRLNRLAADTSLDDYFTQRIAAAEAELAGVGISLTDSADDLMLLVDYTVWQYQNRDSAGSMPSVARKLWETPFCREAVSAMIAPNA